MRMKFNEFTMEQKEKSNMYLYKGANPEKTCKIYLIIKRQCSYCTHLHISIC